MFPFVFFLTKKKSNLNTIQILEIEFIDGNGLWRPIIRVSEFEFTI